MSEHWQNHIATLKEEWRKNPVDAIEEYCQLDSVFGVRERLFDMFSAAMGSQDWKDHRPIDKANWLYFFKRLLQLIEATYLIDSMIEDHQFTYKIVDVDTLPKSTVE